MITHRASKVLVPGSSRIIVGNEMRTIFASSWDMNEPMVVFVNTTYLYFISSSVNPAT